MLHSKSKMRSITPTSLNTLKSFFAYQAELKWHTRRRWIPLQIAARSIPTLNPH